MQISVEVKELTSVRVAYVENKEMSEPEEMHARISAGFRRVRDWVRQQGQNPEARLTIGAIRMVGGRPASYDCCIEVPETVLSGLEDIQIQVLPGGRYAVVSMKKDPDVIGASISQLHQTYLPKHQIEVDGSRPTYEIYAEHTLEYCVPIR